MPLEAVAAAAAAATTTTTTDAMNVVGVKQSTHEEHQCNFHVVRFVPVALVTGAILVHGSRLYSEP